MVTTIITAFNDEENIKDCIESAKLLTSEIIVFDLESQDKTATLAKKNGAQVITYPHANYVEPVREPSIKAAKTDWVFVLDPDERITEELAKEVKTAVKSRDFTHFRIPRKNIFGKKKWLKYGGWWPDYQIRLLNKKFLVSWPKEIHSTPQIEGKQGTLKNSFLHFFHGDFEKMVAKTIVFEDIESELLLKAGRTASTKTFFRKFLGEFQRRLILHLGFFDGAIGIIEAIYQAFSRTITYLYLYEKKKSGTL